MSREQVIEDVALSLGVNPQWLDNLIFFETGGTYSTTIKNPYSSARGLIQIIDSSAKEIGYADSLDAVSRNPDFESQMKNVVYPYLKRWGPFSTKQSLYMAVFYPKYRSVAPDTTFTDSIQKVNPGIKTVQDYINKVDRVKVQKAVLKASPLIVAALVAGIYLIVAKVK
jgi:hypothetical protein